MRPSNKYLTLAWCFHNNTNVQKIQDFCQELTAKYAWDNGCVTHPDHEQEIDVYYDNGKWQLSPDKPNTCRCNDMLVRLSEICYHEQQLNNPPD